MYLQVSYVTNRKKISSDIFHEESNRLKIKIFSWISFKAVTFFKNKKLVSIDVLLTGTAILLKSV